MTNSTLKSPDESISHIVEVLKHGNGKCRLEVREDKCFKAGEWLKVGTVTAYPGGEGEDGKGVWEEAIRFGSYDWAIPDFKEIIEGAQAIFHERTRNATQKLSDADKTRRALEALIHCAVRCGYINPTFDAGVVAEMPFTRPTTVVVDTSAVLQGGLDFVVRFLYTMARIKIPAITHMEILNMAERYFAHRRSAEAEIRLASALFDHVTGQGGQRVLLRLELQTEAEIERPRLGADPLRGIIQPDTDSEDKSLGLQHVQRSFADRLILETAIHHRDRLSPDHPIVVLTADQGLARMTLGEGLHPLFFAGPNPALICGTTLSGTCFRPFIDDMGESPYFHIPLTALIWELACTFGSARIISEDKSAALIVSAIGEGLSWHPFHSRDDLLWVEFQTKEEVDAAAASVAEASVLTSSESATKPSKMPSTVTPSPVISKPTDQATKPRPSVGTLAGSYRFSVPAMMTLMSAFERRETISDKEGMRIVGLETPKRYADLRNFLLAGQFVNKTPDGLSKTPEMESLANAVNTKDLNRIRELLLRVPSFQAFIGELHLGRPVLPQTIESISKSALPTYVALSELCCAALDIVNEGIYLTPQSPVPTEFAAMALESYRKLKSGEEYVLTGKWLEEMARRYGVHPIRTRERLNEARAAGLLERYTEGSTPETQFERHNMALLESSEGKPIVRNLNLYHGDFLIPGKASVSIRITELTK